MDARARGRRGAGVVRLRDRRLPARARRGEGPAAFSGLALARRVPSEEVEAAEVEFDNEVVAEVGDHLHLLLYKPNNIVSKSK